MSTTTTTTALRFDPAEHRYWLGERELPSVTRIIAPLVSFDGIPESVLTFAAERGRAVHRATELWDDDDLDIESLDPALLGYLTAWQRFRRETGAVILQSERPRGSAALGFAGTPDRVAQLPTLGDRVWLLDIKTALTLHDWMGVQLAGYKLLVEGAGGTTVDAVGVVQLRANGTYVLMEYGAPDDARCFLGLLAVHHWRSKHV